MTRSICGKCQKGICRDCLITGCIRCKNLEAAMKLDLPCMIHPKRNGVAAVIKCGNHILTSERLNCRDMNGTWQWPGGAIEDKESAVQAIIREVDEETGVRVIEAEILKIGTGIGFTDDGSPHVTTFFLIEFDERPQVCNREKNLCSDWEWVAID